MINVGIFLFFVASCTAHPHLRIVNGTNALEGEFPSVVSLRENLFHVCGGTILNERHILTAAHCVYCDNATLRNPDIFTIQYGSVLISRSENRSIQVEEIICAPYDPEPAFYDLAVLKLASPIPKDGTWQRVRLAKEFNTTKEHHGVIVGWGALAQKGPFPNNLQKLEVTTFNNTVCGVEFNNFHHICFGAPVGGACFGDSGTSLIVKGKQVGIASFINAECGTTSLKFPNVYARVPSYLDWIEEHSKL